MIPPMAKKKWISSALVSRRLILVPYLAHHVPKYHDWMTDSHLQELTASEPLSLDQEIELQKSWLTDLDKLTFIILDRSWFEHCKGQCETLTAAEINAMVGDVNIFFSKRVEHRSESESNESHGSLIAELEIMIAEPEARGKGIAREALTLIIYYARACFPTAIQCFVAKIGESNTASLACFKKLGFEQESYVAVFREIELALSPEREQTLLSTLKDIEFQIIEYSALQYSLA